MPFPTKGATSLAHPSTKYSALGRRMAFLYIFGLSHPSSIATISMSAMRTGGTPLFSLLLRLGLGTCEGAGMRVGRGWAVGTSGATAAGLAGVAGGTTNASAAPAASAWNAYHGTAAGASAGGGSAVVPCAGAVTAAGAVAGAGTASGLPVTPDSDASVCAGGGGAAGKTSGP